MENLDYIPWKVTLEDREKRHVNKAAVIWFVGLPAAGKSTLGRKLSQKLFDLGCEVALLDGDKLRQSLSKDLGFSESDRSENIRRAGEVAHILYETGQIAVSCFVSPFHKDRQNARALLPEGRFIEAYVKCSLETCKKRDPKSHYKKAIEGVIKEFTGISSPFEVPQNPEIILDTEKFTADELVDQLIQFLRDRKIIKDC